MNLSMFQASVPVLIHGLTNLKGVLQKGEAYAEAKKIDPSVLIQSRLAPDMFPLVRQVQIVTDMSKGCAARLAGVEVPKYEDNEASFAELYARIDKTIAFLSGFTPAQIDGSEAKPVHLKFGANEFSFEGQNYVLYFVFPNFYFHSATAYDILRHNGVELGKRDFLGAV